MSAYQLEQLEQLVLAYPDLLHKLTPAAWEQLADYLWREMTNER